MLLKVWSALAYSIVNMKTSHVVSVLSLTSRYELFVDDLPVWGFVGPPPEETKDSQGHIWTHKSFDIDYNDNRVRLNISATDIIAILDSNHFARNGQVLQQRLQSIRSSSSLAVIMVFHPGIEGDSS